jgi:transposase
LIEVLAQCCAGLDVHRATVVCTVLKKDEEGAVCKETRQYPTFRQKLKQLADRLQEVDVELAVMESRGTYWKAVYEVLEEAEVKTFVVNALSV